MILTDSVILKQMERDRIVIKPFDRKNLGSNSYDVHLSEHVAVYDIDKYESGLLDHNGISMYDPTYLTAIKVPGVLDPKVDNKIRRFKIPETGMVFSPGEIYLCSTIEYTETVDFVPFLEGKSSVGRLGINVHITAGKGDIGFCGHWTLEISVIKPVILYPGMPIAQLIYFYKKGKCLNPYDKKDNAKYSYQSEFPNPSMMWKNF